MGLDMYLRASEYVSRNDWSRDENGDILDTPNEAFKAIVEAFEMQDVIDKNGFAGISVDFPMGYWRKANQIHQWFVDNVQDGEDNCGSYYVTREQLEELKEVLAKLEEPKKMPDPQPEAQSEPAKPQPAKKR